MEEQSLVTPTDMGRDINQHRSKPRNNIPRFIRNILIGVGIAIVLTCIEAGLWVFNPLHIFGSSSHTFSTLLSNLAHNPLLWLLLLVQVIAACAVMFFIDKPLALRRYIRDVKKSWSDIVHCTPPSHPGRPCMKHPTQAIRIPDLSVPGKVQHLSAFELAQDLANSTGGSISHQLLLGASGAGKTVLFHYYLHMLVRQSRSIIFGRIKSRFIYHYTNITSILILKQLLHQVKNLWSEHIHS